MISLAETGILWMQAGGDRAREKTVALYIGFPVGGPSGRRFPEAGKKDTNSNIYSYPVARKERLATGQEGAGQYPHE